MSVEFKLPELGVDLHEIQGSGPAGRITQEDVVRAHERTAPAAPAGAAQPPFPDFEKFGPVKRQPLNKIARTAIKNLRTSWAVVPHVTQHDLADVTDLDAEREELILKQHYHMGVAVDTDEGLLVPVIRNTD